MRVVSCGLLILITDYRALILVTNLPSRILRTFALRLIRRDKVGAIPSMDRDLVDPKTFFNQNRADPLCSAQGQCIVVIHWPDICGTGH